MNNIVKAVITMEDDAIIELELYPDIAPQSVYNFVSLARSGFYNGLTFHRIIQGFMIQGGCPSGTGIGGPGYCIKGEFNQNNHINELKHTTGVISMARAQDYDSAGSQFFIVHNDSPFLDGAYAAFGKVTEGFDVVDEIAMTPTSDDNGTVVRNRQPQIKSIIIEGDVTLPEPDKLECR